MSNILINLFSESLTDEDFERYTNKAPTQFEVFNYRFPVNEMFPDIVEAIINTLRQDYGLDILNTSIILQTNVADIGHFSAKFYAELLDGVVIVTEKVDLLTDHQKKNNFMLKVMRIEMTDLRLHKIFIHDNNNIDINYLKFLYSYRLFNEIEDVNNLAVVKSEKLRFDSIFMFEEDSIETTFALSNKNCFKYRDLEIKKDPISYIDEEFGIYQLVNFIMNIEMPLIEDKKYILESIITHAIRIKKNEKLIDYIVNYINLQSLSLQKFADYNYFCMLLGDNFGLKRQYTFLRDNYNELNPIQVHALITNSLFYQSKLNQIPYSDLFKDRLFLMGKINQFLGKKIVLPKVQKRIDNRVAIVAGQLLSINHAPTKWAFDYANMLKEHNPKLEIKIFVEDWANYSPGELAWMNTFFSADSAINQQHHKEYLHSEIEVYYSNSKLERKKRIQQDVKAITSFQPSIIYKTGSKYNLSVDLLYPYFPIISHTMGGAEDCSFVDVFTGGYHSEEMDDMYQEQGLDEYFYIPHTVGIEAPVSIEKKFRNQFGLGSNDFVLVTVGNRLEVEITIEFLNQIANVLDDNSQAKWLIVGTRELPIIKDNFERLLTEKKVIYVSYERNLFDLYKICDVYVNPIRNAGGTSAATAMKAKIPIVTTSPESHVGHFVGTENCIGREDFTLEIQKLINEKDYYQEKSTMMFNRIEKEFSFEKTVKDLMEIFDISKQKFEERQGK